MDRKNLLADQLEFYRGLGVTHLNLALPSLKSMEAGIKACQRCSFGPSRNGVLAGWGSPRAELMFVVDGLSEEALQIGEPLAREAGDLLHRIIKAIDMNPEDVFITNSVKCCPVETMKPGPGEIESCRPWVISQIRVVDPLVIVPLGSTASHCVLSTSESISVLRGKIHSIGKYQVLPTFHPQYLLRNPRAKSEVWHDMKMVRSLLKQRR
jgi:DNA polymerase